MRPAGIQILFPYGTGAVERLGTNLGKKKKKKKDLRFLYYVWEMVQIDPLS